jgi:hypothetical protein
MRTVLSAALIIAAILWGGIGDRSAMAIMPATIGPGARIIHKVVNVCGSRGCMPVQTKRVQHHKSGAVPAKHI